jgi:hypothetical protein
MKAGGIDEKSISVVAQGFIMLKICGAVINACSFRKMKLKKESPTPSRRESD